MADLAVVIDELVLPVAVDREALVAAIALELDRLGDVSTSRGGADVADVRLRLPVGHPDLSEVAPLAAAIALGIQRGMGG